MKTFAKYAVSIILTVGFLYFAYKGTDFPRLLDILSHTNYLWVLAALPPLLVSHLFRTWRWEYLLRPVKKDLRFRNLWSALVVGYMLNNLLPKVGELVRPLAINKLERVSRSAAFGTLIVERIFDVLSFLVMVALLPLFYSGPLLQTFPWLREAGIWITIVTLSGLGVCVFFMVNRETVVRFLEFFTRHLSEKRAKLIHRIAHSFLDGFLFLKDPGNYLIIGILSILVWGLYIFMTYLPFYAFGLTEKYNLDFGSAFVLQTISSIGYMIPTPGATGSYHYFTVETLTKLYHVDAELARSYAAVTHAVGFISITLIGLYYFWIDKLHLAEFKAKDEEPELNEIS